MRIEIRLLRTQEQHKSVFRNLSSKRICTPELGWSSCYNRFTGAWLVELLQSLHGSLVGRAVKIVSRENG
jgi:hypothetical protein